MSDDDLEYEHWMLYALNLAENAQSMGEVPVGAVVVSDGEVIGEGWNQTISLHDPTAHAEILAIRAACEAVGNYRLPGADLYVTLEPCPMCAGAIVHTRLNKVVYATPDPRTGAAHSVFQLLNSSQLNHRCELVSGVQQERASEMLKAFFRAKR